jgi:hypothetical protein
MRLPGAPTGLAPPIKRFTPTHTFTYANRTVSLHPLRKFLSKPCILVISSISGTAVESPLLSEGGKKR